MFAITSYFSSPKVEDQSRLLTKPQKVALAIVGLLIVAAISASVLTHLTLRGINLGPLNHLSSFNCIPTLSFGGSMALVALIDFAVLTTLFSKRIKALLKSLNDSKNAYTQTSDELTKLTSSLERKKAQEQTIENLKKEIESLKIQIANQDALFKRSVSEHENLYEKFYKLGQEKDRLMLEVENLKEKLETEEKSNKVTGQELSNRYRSLSTQVEEKTKEFKKTSALLEQKTKEVEDLLSQKQSLVNEKQTLAKKIEQLTLESIQLSSKLDQTNSRIKLLEQEGIQTSQDYLHLSETNKNLKQQIKELLEELERLRNCQPSSLGLSENNNTQKKTSDELLEDLSKSLSELTSKIDSPELSEVQKHLQATQSAVEEQRKASLKHTDSLKQLDEKASLLSNFELTADTKKIIDDYLPEESYPNEARLVLNKTSVIFFNNSKELPNFKSNLKGAFNAFLDYLSYKQFSSLDQKEDSLVVKKYHEASDLFSSFEEDLGNSLIEAMSSIPEVPKLSTFFDGMRTFINEAETTEERAYRINACRTSISKYQSEFIPNTSRRNTIDQLNKKDQQIDEENEKKRIELNRQKIESALHIKLGPRGQEHNYSLLNLSFKKAFNNETKNKDSYQLRALSSVKLHQGKHCFSEDTHETSLKEISKLNEKFHSNPSLISDQEVEKFSETCEQIKKDLDIIQDQSSKIIHLFFKN